MQKGRAEPLLNHPRYEKVKDLNSGTFGFVQLARDKLTGETWAIKFIERGEKITKYVEREIINHRCLVHPHIVQFREVFLTSTHLCIAMEFAPGGDMFEYVVKKNGLREDEARWFFQQLIVGLDYCHRMGVVNRDIKLENTLLDSSPRPLVKICDFGYSKHEKFQSAPGSRVGTPAYLAPEVILTTKGKTYDGKIADIWSCGVMLYVMLVGAYPFERPEDKHDNQKLQKMIQRILHVDYHIPPHVRVSDDCKDLLSKILVADPSKRITVEGIYNHKWYLKGLPPGVREMNDRVQPTPEGLQVGAQRQGLETVQESENAPHDAPQPQPQQRGLWACATCFPPIARKLSSAGSSGSHNPSDPVRSDGGAPAPAMVVAPAATYPGWTPSVPSQTVEEIKRLIEESRKAGAALTGGAAIETDEYIDDAMDNMYDESSLDYND